MNTIQGMGMRGRLMALFGTAMIACGTLLDNRWLQLDGRRLKFAAQLRQGTGFSGARTHVVADPAMSSRWPGRASGR